MRTAQIERKTKETDIKLSVDLDGNGVVEINTGIGFFDHMLTALAVHSGVDITVDCKGDLNVDGHHSVEDIGICLGKAFSEALGDKSGIARYGSAFVPMDEALSRVCIDFSNRIGFVWKVELPGETAGGIEASMFEHFFKTVCENARMNLHVELFYGSDNHHCLESIFKAFARSVAMAVAPSRNVKGVPSSKGVL